jgi:hypothetical protein
MMFFTLRAGCTRSANYIKLVCSACTMKFKEYDRAAFEEFAHYGSANSSKPAKSWEDLRERLVRDSMLSQEFSLLDNFWRGKLNAVKPRNCFPFSTVINPAKDFSEVVDFAALFNVNEAERKKLEALSRQSIWYSRRAVA